MCLERLRKVRASGNRNEIQRAETAYFQALQWVYDAAVGAVAVPVTDSPYRSGAGQFRSRFFLFRNAISRLFLAMVKLGSSCIAFL